MAETKIKTQAFTSLNLGAWTAFTPSWTNLTNNGAGAVNQGHYCLIGKSVFVRVRVVLGATPSISGIPIMAFPVTKATYSSTTYLGICNYGDLNTANYFGTINSAGELIVYNAGGTYLAVAGVSSTAPFTWVAGDWFTLQFSYEAS